MEGYFLIPNEESYIQAKSLLHKRYGDPFSVAGALRDKLDDWPRIGGRDAIGLRKLAEFLRQCSKAMLSIPSLNILNDCQENKKILGKLPEWLVTRWSRTAATFKEKNNDYPPFNIFSDFVTHEADIACDPVTGYIGSKASSERNQKSLTRVTGLRSMNTNVSEGRNVPCVLGKVITLMTVDLF